MFIWTPLRTITQRTFAQKTFAQGEFLAKKIFPQEAFVQERPSLPRRLFVQEDVCPFGTIVQRHFCNKGHPSGKVCGLEQIADKQKSDTLVIILREILTCKPRAASGIFCS